MTFWVIEPNYRQRLLLIEPRDRFLREPPRVAAFLERRIVTRRGVPGAPHCTADAAAPAVRRAGGAAPGSGAASGGRSGSRVHATERSANPSSCRTRHQPQMTNDLYNLALEQRQMFGRRGRRLNPSAELTALKREFPFFSTDAFSQSLQQALQDLDRAYEAFFEGRAGYPTPRRKFVHDSMRFPQPYTKAGVAIVLGRDSIKLPKFGWLSIVRHRKIKGRMKNVTLTREGDRWYVVIETERDIADPVPRMDLPAVGLDIGVNRPIATSEGNTVALPQVSRDEMERRAHLARRHSRSQKRSKGREATRARLRALDRFLADRRKDASHKATTDLVQNHGLIGVEALHVRAMTASARGTAEDPGRNVRQKAGLNRRMLDVAPGEIRRQLEYKAAWTGRVVIAVPAAYTSQDCSGCEARGHIERGERMFVCETCGAVIDRDTNAARNIRARAVIEHGRQTGGDSPWIEQQWRPEAGTPKAACLVRRAGQAGKSLVLQGEE
ncbi:RNA-guided endonuclease InsQ/TnpB family protein [Methylobacterium komagatae]